MGYLVMRVTVPGGTEGTDEDLSDVPADLVALNLSEDGSAAEVLGRMSFRTGREASEHLARLVGSGVGGGG